MDDFSKKSLERQPGRNGELSDLLISDDKLDCFGLQKISKNIADDHFRSSELAGPNLAQVAHKHEKNLALPHYWN